MRRTAAGTAVASPSPAFAGRNEAHLGHQVAHGWLVEPKAGGKRAIDGIFAAMLPNVVGVGGQPVGKIDPEPICAQPPERESCAAQIGASIQHRCRRFG